MSDANDVEDIYTLSPSQEGMLFHSLLAEGEGVFVEQVELTLPPGVHLRTFAAAWQRVVDEHPVLRTSFHWKETDAPVQVVHRRATLPVHLLDWRSASEDTARRRLDAWRAEDWRQGFTLERPPLMRIALVRMPRDVRMILSFHHAIIDGWSLELLYSDVAMAYDHATRGVHARLRARRPYREYIGWLRQQDFAAAREYWTNQLRHAVPVVFPRQLGEYRVLGSAPPSGGVAEHRLRLSTDITEQVSAAARRHQVTVNTLMQAAWSLLLHADRSTDDVLFGEVVAGRPTELDGADEMIGLFINTIPARVIVEPDAEVSDWLQALQRTRIEARQFAHTPLARLHQCAGVRPGDLLFNTLLVFENYPMKSTGLGDTEAGGLPFQRTNYPLTLFVGAKPVVWFKLIHHVDLLVPDAGERLLRHLAGMLASIISSPSRRVRDVPLMSAKDRQRVVIEWNETRREETTEESIPMTFAARVACASNAVAVIDGPEQVTFGNLDRQAELIARALRRRGVGPGALVGVALNRGVTLVATLIGVLKTGAAYLPIDPAYPTARITHMLTDSGVTIVVTTEGLLGELDHEVTLIDVDRLADESEPVVAPGTSPRVVDDDVAYVIYTSGSTGAPKGVCGTHAGVLNRSRWMSHEYPFERDERCCQRTAISFVDSVAEIFGPLLAGAAIAVAPTEVVKDPVAFVAWLRRHAITRLVAVPSLLRTMIDARTAASPPLPDLRICVSSGEALPADLAEAVREHFPTLRLINLYGCSEVAADATCYEVGEPGGSRLVPIGRPIDNTTAYVLDPHLNPVPIGIPGELHIGGSGLARGYLHRPELTTQRFIPHPFDPTPGARLYKTGDLTRWLPDGNLDYLGRLDNQIKLRGHRIELGEIETTLRHHPTITDATVILREDTPGEPRLIAYLIPTNPDTPPPPANELRHTLATTLPDHMLPAAYVTLDTLPLTPNGKIDRNALPPPDTTRPQPADTYTAPTTPTEDTLTRIYADLLNLDTIGTNDNFFDLGGHSILAIRLTSRVHDTLTVELPLTAIFQHPTPASLAAYISDESPDADGVSRRAQLYLRVLEMSDEEAAQAAGLGHDAT